MRRWLAISPVASHLMAFSRIRQKHGSDIGLNGRMQFEHHIYEGYTIERKDTNVSTLLPDRVLVLAQ